MLSKIRIPGPYAVLAVGLLMVLILTTSMNSSPQIDVPGSQSQRVLDQLLDFAHFPIYALLTFLIVVAFDDFRFFFLFTALTIAVLFGILNEFVQLHVPGREFSFKDMLVNAAGALLVIFFFARLKKTF